MDLQLVPCLEKSLLTFDHATSGIIRLMHMGVRTLHLPPLSTVPPAPGSEWRTHVPTDPALKARCLINSQTCS